MPTLYAEPGGMTAYGSTAPVLFMAGYAWAQSGDGKRIMDEADRIIKERWEALRTKPVLTRMLAELEELLLEDDEELHPTPAALDILRRHLSIMGLALQERFPYGYVMDDGAQGARVEWENKSARAYVSLVIHAQPGSSDYIYYQASDGKELLPLHVHTLISTLSRFVAK
jgi:hypothetical protein